MLIPSATLKFEHGIKEKVKDEERKWLCMCKGSQIVTTMTYILAFGNDEQTIAWVRTTNHEKDHDDLAEAEQGRSRKSSMRSLS